MAKITRVGQKLYASTAGANQIAKYGSLAAGSPIVYSGATVDPVALQSLSQFLDGWFSAVIGANSPAIEDMNALFYLVFRQLAYVLQEGIAEWDSTTTYFIGSVVNSSGVFYVSLTDNNLNNALSDTANWKVQNSGVKNVSTTYTILTTDDYIRCDSTSAGFTVTLPTIASSIGKEFKIKNVGANPIILAANGSETMDGVNNSSLLPVNPLGVEFGSMIVFNNGTTWDIY